MRHVGRLVLIVALLLSSFAAGYGQPSGATTWPFQGDVFDTPYGGLADGVYSMRFAIYDAVSGGNRLWPTAAEYELHTLVIVMGGRFSVDLGSNGQPITSAATKATASYVQVWVCQPAGFDCAGYEPLPERLPLAAPAGMSLETPLPESEYEVVDTPSGGTGEAWLLSGNARTSPATDFLGTTDDAPLILRVAGSPALRIEPFPTSPSLIGGHQSNDIAEDAQGAFIGGGRQNQVVGSFGTIAGGDGNWSAANSFVGGGSHNLTRGQHSVIGGGYMNRVSESWATTVGGSMNTASGVISFVGGGQNNEASGEGSIVNGGQFNTADASFSSIGGGSNNCIGPCGMGIIPALSPGEYSFIAGGLGNLITGSYSVAGGSNNTIRGHYSVIAGGYKNTTQWEHTVISGGSYNKALAEHSVVAGGSYNEARAAFSFVAGGSHNTASDPYSFVGGRNGSTSSRLGGSFVWAGDHDEPFEAALGNEFLVRATTGGAFINGGQLTGLGVRAERVGLRVETGRSDLGGTRSRMETIAGYPSPYPLQENPGFDVEVSAISGLAFAQTGLSFNDIAIGVWGQSMGQGIGVLGESKGTGVVSIGVMGSSANSYGVFGETYSTTSGRAGGYFRAYGATGETYGVYAENRSPDGYGIYSKGDVHVEGDLTWTPRLGYVSVGPWAFDTNQWWGVEGSTEVRPPIDCPTSYLWDGVYFAPLYLPHGVLLTRVEFHWKDASNVFDCEFRLRRTDLAGGIIDLAVVSSRGSDGTKAQSGESLNHVVDNKTGTYLLSLDMGCNTWFYGAVIEYEVSKPY